jgi:hypothetical protein
LAGKVDIEVEFSELELSSDEFILKTGAVLRKH